MTRDEALQRLREHAPEIRAKGIVHLELFGSTARNDARPSSDVDLMAQYDKTLRLSLLDVCQFEVELSDLLGSPVDLCSRETLRSFALVTAVKDAILVF